MSEPPGDLALRIERDAVGDPGGGGIAPGEPRLSRKGLIRAIGVGLGLGVFAAGHPADQPGAAAELFVQALEQPRHAVFGGPPAAAENATVNARVHVADHIRLHFRNTPMSQLAPKKTLPAR